MSRVVMFVYNDVTRDSRVLKEAGSLAAAGHEVRVVGRWSGPGSGVPRREDVGGFEIAALSPTQATASASSTRPGPSPM